MHLQSGNTIISGIEPVDELLGGLDRGQLYLVHGDASGKSLFGMSFLIEGLRRGENGALVISYSPEDAVRRFKLLGYDCLEDVYSGRLVILEYSDDIIQKLRKPRELTPVLRELEWRLGETRPARLIFDPVGGVLASAEGDLEAGAVAFAEWARSFGGTVVLIANESYPEIIKVFKPLVAESFRFDVRDAGERAARFISFEKSSGIPDQAIEVDPSRGIFLLGQTHAQRADRAAANHASPPPPSVAELESIREELRAACDQAPKATPGPTAEVNLPGEISVPRHQILSPPENPRLALDRPLPNLLQTRELTPMEEKEFQAPRAQVEPQLSSRPPIVELDLLTEETQPSPAAESSVAGHIDELSDLLDDFGSSESPLDLDLPELEFTYNRPVDTSLHISVGDEVGAKQRAVGSPGVQPAVPEVRVADSGRGSADMTRPRQLRHGRASDLKIDSATAARAVEMLLRPPQADAEFQSHPSYNPPTRAKEVGQPEPPGAAEVRAKDFNVLIIQDDPETCDLITQTLGDYSLETVHDGVSGLAKLISFKPDLVILDFDLPVIDGFKVLTLIRSALNVPIIIVSGSRMRAIDRVMASELGADYYLTKPFSAKELKHKARQLIARYRGLDSWIIRSSSAPGGSSVHGGEPAAAEPEQKLFTPYAEFVAEVEKRVKAAMDGGAVFSVIGCRLARITADGGRLALKLFEIARRVARDADLTSTNPLNDLLILLADAGESGASAFAERFRALVLEELNVEPVLWKRSFPDVEGSTAGSSGAPAQGGEFKRRSADQGAQPRYQAASDRLRADDTAAENTASRDSYIDFLEHL